MSDNVLDFQWGAKPEVVEGIQEIHTFATWRFATMKRVSFAKGESIEVPEIQINGEPFRRNGMKEGGNLKAYFLEVTKQSSQGEDYTYVEVLTTATNIKLTKAQVEMFPNVYVTEKQQKALDENGEAWFSLMSNLTQPGLNLLPEKTFAQIAMGKPFHAKCQDVSYNRRESGETNEQGNPKYWYDSYHTNWQLFNSREEMLAANQEDRANSGNNGNATGYTYPQKWGDNAEVMMTWAKEKFADENEDKADIFKKVQESGLTPDATPDYAKIMAEVQGVPQELAQL